MEEENFDDIRKLMGSSTDPFSIEGSRELLKDSSNNSFKYNNLFEEREERSIENTADTDSKYLTVWDDPTDSTKIENKKADRQPWMHKFGAGVGRVGTKVASELLKMPGVVGGIAEGALGQLSDGISGSDNTDFMQVAFNNAWIQGVSELEEDIKQDALPVYVKRAVKDGNLWDNITAIDFWATEGADGLGYIVSMLAPGSAINKFGVGSKLFGVSKAAKMANKTDEAANVLSNLGVTPKNADLFTATMANTIFEAGAEAKGAMDGFIGELDKRRLLHQDNPNYLSEEEYNELSKKQSEVGRNVFLANAAILVGPNAIMSKMLWGKPRNKSIGSILGKNNNIKEVGSPSLLKKARLYADDFSTASLREGFFEEGFQSTTEEFFTKKGLGEDTGTFAESYLDMLGTVDGQKAIFLGSAFGGGIQTYSGGKSREAERKTTNALIRNSNSVLSDFYNVFSEDIYVKEDGQVKFDPETNRPEIDNKKIIDKLKGLSSIEALSARYDVAIEQNDTEFIEQVQEAVTTNLIKPFIVNDNLGSDVLKQHLENSKELQKITEREGVDTNEYISNILQKAEVLKKAYNTFENFAPSLMKLENENATSQEKVDFYNKLSMQYVDNKSRKLFLENKQKEFDNLLDELLEEKGRTRNEFIENKALARDLKLQDGRIDRVSNKLESLTKSIKEVKEADESFWKEAKVSEYFNSEVKKKRKLDEEIKNSESVENTLSKIKNAKTVKEVKNIKVDTNSASSHLEKEKKRKIEEIKKSTQKKSEEISEKNKQYSLQKQQEAEELKNKFNYIKNNYSKGEVITIPEGFEVDKSLVGTSAIIGNIGEKEITFTTETGKQISVDTSLFFKETFNPELNFSTEGGNDIKQEEVFDTNSGEILEEKNNAKIISTDKSTGDKLDFVEQSVIDFERTPRDKSGESKQLEINNSKDLSDNQTKAVNLVKNEDFTNIEFLIDNLPLNIKLTDTVSAPLETKSETSKEYNDVFNKTSREMRKVVIKELSKGTPISSITVPIAGQWNGDLQLEKEVLENNLVGLFEFGENIKNIKSKDFYVVDDLNALRNTSNEYFPVSRELAKGEVYLKIKMANGKPFPLKLNVKKINESQAELLYELYKYRFQDIKEGKSKRISELEEDLLTKVKELFSKEIELFSKNKKSIKDLTIKDIVDFLIWDGSKNPKSQVRFSKGDLLVMNKTYSVEDFQTEQGKNDFIYNLTNNKRHHIKYKRRSQEGVNSMNLENRSYLEYLINNSILNTNAVVGKPTFAGNTSMYLHTDQVKVNGKLSEFNKGIFKENPPKNTTTSVGEDIGVQSNIDFSKFGINLSNKEVKPEPKVKKPFTLSQEDQLKLKEQLKALGETLEVNIGKTDYILTTKNYFVLDITNNKVVTDLEKISKVIDSYNKNMLIKNFKIDKKSALNIWKSRINNVSLQDNNITKKMTEKIDFSKINDSKAQEAINTLIKNYSNKNTIKDIQIILVQNKNSTIQNKLKAIFELLESKNNSREDLKTKCGI